MTILETAACKKSSLFLHVESWN